MQSTATIPTEVAPTQTTIPQRMRGVVVSWFGGPTKLKYSEELKVPIVKEGQLLIEVHAAGINPVDVKMRSGRLPIFLPPGILGREFSGVVAATGPGTSRFKVGDEVFGIVPATYSGSHAEYTVTNEKCVALKPKSITHVEAAGLPVVGITSWMALVETGNVRKGDKVLIQGGSGGVGTFAIQLAKHLGAHVTTTASHKHTEFLTKLGADRVIDYQKEQFDAIIEKRSLDLVLDTVGGKTMKRAYPLLKPDGKLVSLVYGPFDGVYHYFTSRIRGPTFYPILMDGKRGDILEQIATLVDKGTVKPVVDSVFPLDTAHQAHIKLESQHPLGKVIIQMKDEVSAST